MHIIAPFQFHNFLDIMTLLTDKHLISWEKSKHGMEKYLSWFYYGDQ